MLEHSHLLLIILIEKIPCESFGLKHDPDNVTASNSILLSAQGALDGGLDIPHSEKRFVGYSAEDKSLDAETLRKHIYGGHVAEYMEEMQEEAPEKYQVRPHTALVIYN